MKVAVKGFKIPVYRMEDIPKMLDELPTAEENPILKAIEEIKARKKHEEELDEKL